MDMTYFWCSCIKKCGRSMCEPTLGHQMVCFESRINVILVDTNSNSHQHVLWSLHNLPFNLQEILKGFKSKVIIDKVSVIYNLTVQ
ncbi:hypothetical protein AQUCO_00300318v1 [Aquilegia coerulea]|uniref:Uncharacterized protein n=1 Tax=Aquilegia coerulea TaxID=218851 RepID=A0A2G5EYA9_AQUCA|nr:hypothetical protein AQUCO_00300318v1 [Aquilegia coerulea]